MRFEIFITEDGHDSAITEFDAKTGDGTPMTEFMHDFDGSKPVYSFSVPPAMDSFYKGEDAMDLTSTQMWVIAKMVHQAFTIAYQMAKREER